MQNGREFVEELVKVLESKDRKKVDYEKAELYLLRFLSYLKDRNEWIDQNEKKQEKCEVTIKAEKMPEKSEE